MSIGYRVIEMAERAKVNAAIIPRATMTCTFNMDGETYQIAVRLAANPKALQETGDGATR